MTFQELKNIAREHRPKIKGFSHMSKGELIEVLQEKNVLTQEDKDKFQKIDHERLKSIRNHPRPVEIFDRETGEKTVYHSIYNAGKAYGVNARTISTYDGKIWKHRFEIKCI